MTLTEEQVRYVAALANLRLTDAEVENMAVQLSAILEHMDRLGEIDTEGVEPMRQVLSQGDDQGTMRPDEVRPSLSNDEALANAIYPGQGYFRVPRVIER